MVVHTDLSRKADKNVASTSSSKFKLNAMAAAFSALSAVSLQSVAQDASSVGVVEELIVTGTRATIQNSIDLKRDSITVVDGLSEDEIGAIPALSIGEALETITGTVGHRENGGASEISVRGLGPFLGTTVVNGREATNGSGNRAVNFSIFPSEMFNKIAVHKTQSAEYIEGAVSGQIHLDTKKPLEYGKQTFQFSAKAAYSPDEQDLADGQDIGSRFTASYIDQFDIGDAGSIGVSIGAQVRDESNPEQEYTTGTGGGRLEACRLQSFDSNALPYNIDNITECFDEGSGVNNREVQGIIDSDPNDDINSVDDIPFAYVARDHRFRQNITGDKREALFGVLQWQPTDELDITLDLQYSERDQTELRYDLDFGTTQEDIRALESNPRTGVVRSVTVDTDIQANTTDFRRLEEYEGAGLNIEFQATDDLKLSFDLSYSDTFRVEDDVEINLGYNESGLDPLGDLSDSAFDDDEYFVRIDRDVSGTNGVSLFTFEEGGSNIDITDPRFYTAQDVAQVRLRRQIRENTINAVRGDFELATDWGIINTLKGGARLSELTYLTRGDDNRNTPGVTEFDDEEFDGVAGGSETQESAELILEAVENCANDTVPFSDFLGAQVGNRNLVTYEDGTGTSEWATFDFNCTANTLLRNWGGLDGVGFQEDIFSETRDVTETTFATYLQAEFETEIGGFLTRGNFGARIVDTEIHSVGYRAPLTVTEEIDDEGETGFRVAADQNSLEAIGVKTGYTEILPSATVVVDLSDELVLRGGIFRGLSRPDPDAYGFGRIVNTNDSDGSDLFSSLTEAVNGISATGNPNLKPLDSINYDLGIEWYANDDTILSLALYYKEFKAAFENTVQEETIEIDGEDVTGLVSVTQTSDDESAIYGAEITATHAFDYLPGFLSGFGGTFSYNYAQSDFEFEDGFGGDGTQLTVNPDGTVTELDLIGILPPANLFGLSEHVTATQLYWQNDLVNVQAIYKTRSDYFQAFGRDTNARIRYTDDSSTLDVRLSYKVYDGVTLSVEGKNVLDEPRRDFRAVDGNVQQVLSFGPRYFAGVKVKF